MCSDTSYGNSTAEKGFSIIKFMLDHYSSTLKEETIVALFLVKDELFRVGGIFYFPINCDLITLVKSPKTKYIADLEAK